MRYCGGVEEVELRQLCRWWCSLSRISSEGGGVSEQGQGPHSGRGKEEERQLCSLCCCSVVNPGGSSLWDNELMRWLVEMGINKWRARMK
ncbi:hypothetical protein ABZP36_033218 [Zizania latifolia]